MDILLAVISGITVFALAVISTTMWQPMALAILVSSVAEVHLRLDLGIRIGETMTLTPADGLFPVAAIAATFRLFAHRRNADIRAAWLICALILLLGFFHGVARYGIIEAAIGYRQFFYLSAGIVYFASFDYRPNEQRLAMTMMVAAGLVLMAFTVAAWLLPGLAPVEIVLNAFDEYRVIPAVGSMFLNLAFLLALPSWTTTGHGMLRRALSPLFFLTVLLLYHRTVWVTLAVAVMILMALARRRIVMHLLALTTAGIVLVAIWAAMAGIEADIISAPLASAFDEVRQDDSSLAWRMEGWKALTARSIDHGLPTVLFGEGFGVDFERRIGWSTFNFSPHNMFLEVYLTCGLVGLAAYLFPFLAMAARLRRLAVREAGDLGDGAIFTAAIIAIAVYGLSYGHRYDVAFLIGVLTPLASRLAAERAQSP